MNSNGNDTGICGVGGWVGIYICIYMCGVCGCGCGCGCVGVCRASVNQRFRHLCVLCDMYIHNIYIYIHT
jgi:hypothetical protein